MLGSEAASDSKLNSALARSPANVVHLHPQLPGRYHNDRKCARQGRLPIPTRASGFRQSPVHHRHGIRQRLAAARLCTTEDVEAVAYGAGDDGALDGQGGREGLRGEYETTTDK
jgi:hypothetical protein